MHTGVFGKYKKKLLFQNFVVSCSWQYLERSDSNPRSRFCIILQSWQELAEFVERLCSILSQDLGTRLLKFLKDLDKNFDLGKPAHGVDHSRK